MDDRESARFEVAGHSAVSGRGVFIYGHIRSGRFREGMIIFANGRPPALTIAHIEFMDKVSTHEAHIALFFREKPDLEMLREMFPVGVLVQAYDPADDEREKRCNLNVAIRLAKTRLELHRDPDSPLRAAFEAMADEDAVTLGPPTLTVEAHRAEAQRCLAEVERLSRCDHEAAKHAVLQASAHALWADDPSLVKDACQAFDRLRIHDDDYPFRSDLGADREDPAAMDDSYRPTTEQIQAALEPKRGRWATFLANVKAR